MGTTPKTRSAKDGLQELLKGVADGTAEFVAEQMRKNSTPSPSTLTALHDEAHSRTPLGERYERTEQFGMLGGAFVGKSNHEQLVSKRELVDGLRRRTNVTTGPLGPWGTPPDEYRSTPTPAAVIVPLVNVVPTEDAIVKVGEQVDAAPVAVATPYGSNATQSGISYTAELPDFDWIPVFAVVSKGAFTDKGVVREAVLSQLVTVDLGAALDLSVWNEITEASIPTQDVGSDDRVTAIVKAAGQVRDEKFGVGGLTVVYHPDDATALVGDVDAATELKLRLAGVTGFAVSTLVDPGAPIVGDYRRGVTQYVAQGVAVEISDSHDVLFRQGLLTVIATTRVVSRCHFPAAFCQVTSF